MSFDTDHGHLDVPPPRKKLSFDPTINLGHVLTMFLMVGSGMTMYFNLDKRLAKQEDLAPFVASARDEKDRAFSNGLITLSADIKEVKSAVDKLSLTVQVQSAVANAAATSGKK